MKSFKLTLLILVLILLSANERYVKYFRNNHDFLTGSHVPKSEIIRKNHIRAEYDKLDRLSIKSEVNNKGEVLSQEQFSYVNNNKTIRQKDLVNRDGHIFYKTIFGREPESLSYIKWVFGVDSVKKWDDRFTTSELNEIDKPENYNFFDVDAFEYGGKEFNYDSLGRITRDEWLRRPGGKSMHKFLYKYYDDIDITHLFEYDSNGVLIMDVKLSPDGTEAVFFFTGPADSSFQNNSLVNYNLDGNLKWGFVNWVTPGQIDSSRVNLKAFDRGDHIISLLSDSVLEDSSVYSIHFDGEGVKGYMATKRTISHITYDISPPLMTLDMNKYIKDISLSFTYSEPIDTAYIVWTPDSNFKDIPSDTVALSKIEIGQTGRFKPVNQKPLIDGVMYDPRIYAVDRAGNLSNPPGIKEDVIFDITPPSLSIINPKSGEWLNHQLIDIITSELIKSWTVSVNREGGFEDSNAPYKHTFTDTLSDSSFVDLFEFFQLNDGSIYSYSIIGIDLAGNISDTARIDSIHYDITPPILTFIYPFDDEAINSSTISYASSENLSAGEFLWTQNDGLIDTLSPHIVELIADELTSKEKIKVDLINKPLLNDGSFYSILLTGIDLAGNESEPVKRSNILYDITPPSFTDITPKSGSALNYQEVSYSLSETIFKGSIIWTQISGVVDSNSPRIIEFITDEMTEGLHEVILLDNMPILQDGGIYQIQFTGLDRAGNIADTISIDDILYDFTVPEAVIDYPLPQSISNTTAISYNLSEDLYRAEFKWIWIGGVEDTLAPYIAILNELEMTEGAHVETTLENIPTVVENALYTLSFSGQDRAENQTLTTFIPGLQYDFTPPELTWFMPKDGEALNHKKVQFENSELLDRATLTWLWVAGVSDPDSIHTMELIGEELERGVFIESIIKNDPPLVDGGIYNISYIGFDPAGNESNHIIVNNILYDVTEPEITIIYPLPRSISRTSAVTYILSENLFEGEFKWRWLGGIKDTLAPYSAELSLEEREVGKHIEVELENNPMVVENALYTMTFVGSDRAGNKTKPAFVAGLQYDFTPPELTILYPTDGMAINNKNINFINSELLQSAQMIWRWTGGLLDSDSTHIVDLIGEELIADEIGPIILSNSLSLVDGAEYSLLYVAFDPAGNQSDTVRMDDIFYDITPPNITISYPQPNIFTTETNFKFDINEDIYNFNIEWTGKSSGEKDNIVSYTSPDILVESELNSDDLFIPELKDGFNYTILLNGLDRAGNVAMPFELKDIKIDLTPPKFTTLYPLEGSFINKLDFSWILSENINSGILSFISLKDTLLVELSDGDKNIGKREISPLLNMVSLNDGTKYSISIKGTDFAGNISDVLTVDKITYDISPPQLTINLPRPDSFVNNLDVIYVANEPLISAQMIWFDDLGDSVSYDLRASDLTLGKHILKDYNIITKEGVSYRILINANDRANNNAKSDTIENVMFDVTPPILTLQSPIPNNPVNHTKVSFDISEAIQIGSIEWRVVEGNDPKGSHIHPILGEQLKGGVFVDHTFLSPPELVNGVLYDLIIKGTDLAGNKSEAVSINNILYDIAPPNFIDLEPIVDTFIRVPSISYNLTEDLAEGKIYFDYVGGVTDPKTTHMITLAGTKKQKGVRGGKLPSSFIALTNGSIYDIRFEGVDEAGNAAPVTTIKNITFDNEPPEIIVNEPLNKTFINNSIFTYNLSEDLVSGSILITRDSGSPDSNSPHTILLQEEYLKSGEKLISDIKWVDGSTYSIIINGDDRAGNKANTIELTQITYDITPPNIKINNFNNDKYINYNTLSYTLSENLLESSIIFTQISEPMDISSPQIIELEGSELNKGSFNDIILKNGPKLINGAMYNIAMTGVDPAGNESNQISLANVTFDNESPKISISQPLDSEQIKRTIISFISSENLLNADVIYRQTSGTADINSPHRIPINSSNLSSGFHSDIDLGFASQLADGGRYEVSIEAYDKAGNEATVSPINDVFFDILPPKLTLSAPISLSLINSAIVSYSTSESMKKSNIVFLRVKGNEDPNSPHTIDLTGQRLEIGDHFSEVFDQSIQLKDGSIYNIELTGEDFAGNIANKVSIENITFDISSPLMSISSPLEKGFYSTIELSYEINESLSSGVIVFEQESGSSDPMSPHRIELINEQLSKGKHEGININALTDLTPNSTYKVWLEGIDLAGNEGKSSEIRSITFDNISPNIAIISPEPGSFNNSKSLGLKTNEVLSEARVVWTWVEGSSDSKGQHESKLVGDQLMDGLYPEVNFDPAPSLVSDALYNVTFYGIDRAGNTSNYELASIYYDNNPPEITGTYPITNDFTNINEVEYLVKEQLISGSVFWLAVDGSSQQEVQLIGPELDPGAFNKGQLTNQKELIDGTSYNLSISSIDRSGNESTIVLAKNITFDKTKPKFTEVSPITSSRINSQLITWTVNEELLSGKYTWIHMGGSEDPSAPHTFDLTPDLLKIGSFDNSALGDLNLVADAMYRITLEGTDKANNTGKKFLMSIVYDDKPPTIEINYPESNTSVKELDIAYFISESLSGGQFIYTQVGGLTDPNSPVSFNLAGSELETIFESPKVPKNPPVLNDGSIYNIQFKGEDLATNASSSNIIENVKYDITKPIITIFYPENKSNFMGTEIDIEISEDLKDGTIVWSRTGGLNDQVTKHKIPLANQYLSAGRYKKAKLPMEKSLSSSVVYSLGVEAVDFAGNQAEPVLVEFIEYIRNMAGNWYYKGQIIEVVWVFEPDETGLTGSFMQGLSLGTKISNQEKGQFTIDFTEKPWVITIDMDNPDKNRISLFEFIDNTHIRVVTGEKKPSSMNDGEIMEYEWRPE